MLVTLRKQDLLLHCFDDDVERFLVGREKKHYKQKFYLPAIRKSIFSNFEVIFGVSESQLLDNFTHKGEKVEKRFLQRRIGHAVDAFFCKADIPEAYDIGEFEEKVKETEGEF